MPIETRDTDRGWKALFDRMRGFREPAHIDVGILESSGEEPHGDGGATILDIGVFNEFGTDTIPERSFIRDWFDEAEPDLREDLTKLMESVVQGKRTRAQALEIMGQRCVGQIQERISAGIEPENAPSTIARKGSSTPLIDTGVLRSSISYQVEDD